MFLVPDSSLLEGLLAALVISVVVFLTRFAYHREGRTALTQAAFTLAVFSLISSIIVAIKSFFGFPPEPSLFVFAAGAIYLISLAATLRTEKKFAEERVPVPVRDYQDQ